jgi:hypothetical protein
VTADSPKCDWTGCGAAPKESIRKARHYIEKHCGERPPPHFEQPGLASKEEIAIARKKRKIAADEVKWAERHSKRDMPLLLR